MSHAFDTGLPKSQRATIRDGAVTLLAGLARLSGGYLEAVIPWGGVIRGYTDDIGVFQLFNALKGRSPAIAVSLGDRSNTSADLSGFNSKGTIDLLVYFVSQHQRGVASVAGRLSPDAAAAGSDAKDPGLEIAMEHAEELLVGQYPGATPSVKKCVLRTEEEITTRDEVTVWQQRYTVLVDRIINPKRGITQMLTGFRSKVRTSDDASQPPANPLVELQTDVP